MFKFLKNTPKKLINVKDDQKFTAGFVQSTDNFILNFVWKLSKFVFSICDQKQNLIS